MGALLLDYLRDMFVSLPYLLLVLVTVPTLGWWLVDKVMTRGYSLKEELFTRDNKVAGMVLGGIVLCLFYIGLSAVLGESASTFQKDILAALLSLVVTAALMAGVYELLGGVVKRYNGGKDLNNEIFEQRNWAAGAMVIALLMGLVNGMTQEDFLGPYPITDLLLALVMAFLGLAVVWVYQFAYGLKGSFLKEFFTDDNSAAGVSLIGFAIGANQILGTVVAEVREAELSLIPSILMLCIGASIFISVLALTRILVEWVFSQFLGIPINDEIFSDNNVGSGFFDAAIVIGSSLVITGVLL